MTEWIDIFLVLILGGALGWLSTRFGFPNAVAQVVLGVDGAVRQALKHRVVARGDAMSRPQRSHLESKEA